MQRLALVLILVISASACREPFDVPDAGNTDAGQDAGAVDAGSGDAGAVDAGSVDAGAVDAGSGDAGPEDAGAVDAGPSLRCPERDGGVPDGGLLRVIAANLSSGNLQTYNPGDGARILAGLKPDITLIQEWNIGANTEVDRRAFVDSTFGGDFCFHIQAGGGIPNGVISRWPILDAGQWVDPQVTNRAFAWALIDVPGPRNLWAVSMHLLTSNASARTLEAQELVMKINQAVPLADLLVIGGDLNTNSRTETAITTFSQVVRTSGPHPVDQSNNENTNAGRSQPYDWVLADPDLAALQVPVKVGAASFAAGLVFDSRVFTPLSAVPPVQAGDSAAVNMQHMAVVKDFLLP